MYKELNTKYALCQDYFQQCVEYFGEAARTQTPTTFFSTFVKFMKSFGQARLENEQRLRAQEMDAVASLASSSNSKNASPQSSMQRQQNVRGSGGANEGLIEELKKRRGGGGNAASGGGAVSGAKGQRVSRPQLKKEINIEDLIEGLCMRSFSGLCCCLIIYFESKILAIT